MPSFVVQNGLRRLARDLKKLDESIPKQIRQLNKDTANIVVRAGKESARSLGSTAGKSASALRASGSTSAIAVLLGNARSPYAIGAEMGSKQGWHKWQFTEYTSDIPSDAFEGSWGRFLGPSIRRNRESILDYWSDHIMSLVNETIPDEIR